MSANTQILRERRAVRLPAWLVVGVALAIAGSLAVVSVSEREPATRPASGTTVTGDAVAQSDAAEMAQLKSAVATQVWARQHGIATDKVGTGEAWQIGAHKRAAAAEFGGRPSPQVLFGDNTAPIEIDGKLCGQCR